ncbi:hypothetical protein BDQ12DRAFT_693428, partial [Crucibulum laeve]
MFLSPNSSLSFLPLRYRTAHLFFHLCSLILSCLLLAISSPSALSSISAPCSLSVFRSLRALSLSSLQTC